LYKAGTLKTNRLNGDFEFDGGQLYITVDANDRKALASLDKEPGFASLKPVKAVVSQHFCVCACK
jgi:hypothetical protein